MAIDLEVKRARNAVFVVFAACGFATASWASRIPDVADLLNLTPGRLGGLLLAPSFGAVVSLPLTGRFVARWGTARTVAYAARLLVLGLIAASLAVSVAESYAWTAVGLVLVGLGMGGWDAAMNNEGALVEIRLGRAIMPWFHAMFSGGTVIAALIGAAMTRWAVPIWLHAFLPVAGGLFISVWSVRQFLPTPPRLVVEPRQAPDRETVVDPAQPRPRPAAARPRSAWLESRTLLVGLVVLAASFAEGTANDWMALAMTQGHDLPKWAGVLGFATFLGAMTLARIIGVFALDRWGRVPTLMGLFGFAAVGSVLVVFGNGSLAFLGAALWGIGASLGFPVGMSAASDDPARSAARISVVSTIGYFAFLGGPPLLGFLGDQVGVLRALLAVSALLVPALLATPAMRPPTTPKGEPARR